MKIRDLIGSNPIWVSPHVSVAEAAHVMQVRGCAFMPVVEGGRAIGVVTDRDLAMALALKGQSPSVTVITDVMSQPVIDVDSETSPEEAARRMLDNNVRRLIVQEDGRFLGVVSVVDLAGLISDEHMSQTLHRLAEQNRPLEGHHETEPIVGLYLG